MPLNRSPLDPAPAASVPTVVRATSPGHDLESTGRVEILVVLCAAAFGAVLRVWQLPSQLLWGDEWTTLMAAVQHGPVWALKTFGVANICTPLVLYYHLALRTCGVGEWVIRAPSLVFGVATLVAFPIAARRHVGPYAAALFAWLLAISPVLVLYSRTARAYAMALFLGVVAVAAAYRWWTSGSGRAAIIYIIGAALSSWLQPTFMPFLLAPPAWFLLARMLRGAGSSSLRSILCLAVATLGATLALLLPALVGDLPGLVAKAGATGRMAGVLDVLAALTFRGGPALTLTLLGLATIGAFEVLRGGGLLRFVSVLAAVELLIVCAVRPAGGGNPVVIARYSLPTAPMALLWVSVGATRLPAKLLPPIGPWVRWLVSAGLVLTIFLAGPLPAVLAPENQWVHRVLQLEVAGRPNAFPLHRAHVPAVYRILAQQPPSSLLIVEASAPSPARFMDTAAIDQEVHQQRILVGLRSGLCESNLPWTELPYRDPRFHLANYVHLADFAGIEARGVDFVVFAKRLRRKDRQSRFTAQDWGGCLDAYSRRYGPPVIDDEDSVVFALSRRARDVAVKIRSSPRVGTNYRK